VLLSAVVLALVDCWHVALRAPGSLTATSVCWLVGLYLAATGAAALVLAGVLRCSRGTTRAAILAAGGCLFAVETWLRALTPLSPWRPWVVAGCIAAAVLAFVPLRAVCARRVPISVALVGLALLALGAFGAVRPLVGARPPTSPSLTTDRELPSFLVIVIDTLRADHLGCYGYGRPTSPALDRLAGEGTLFERAFAQSSWTKPSTASLFTGRFPVQHQTLYERSRIPDVELTIPELLTARGYRTAVLSGNPWVTPEYGFDQGVSDFYSLYDERFTRVTLFMTVLKRLSRLPGGRMQVYNRVKYLVLGELSTTARDTRLVDEAERWLTAHHDRPFFLYLHMMSPHHPYDPPPPFDRFVPDPSHAPVKNYPRKSYLFFEEGDPLPAADFADMVARYDGDVLYADTEVGRLLTVLDRLGLARTTAVVVTADHGEEFYDHRNWGHGQSVYNELIHVPLILRYPGHGAPGARVATPVMHVDMLPTLLDLAGIPLPPAAAGIGASLFSAPQQRDDVLSQLIYRYGEAAALVAGDRVLVTMRRGDDGRSAAYDLATDFGEHHDLPAPADQLRALAELRRRLERTRSAAAESADGVDRDRLKALGYAE